MLNYSTVDVCKRGLKGGLVVTDIVIEILYKKYLNE